MFSVFCTYNKTLLSALVQEFPFNSLHLSASFNSDLYLEGALIRINELDRSVSPHADAHSLYLLE